MAEVTLRRGEENDIYKGHLWIYDNEVEGIRGEFEPGDIVDVVSARGRFLGRGYINPKSKILVRLMTGKKEEIDRGFLKRKIEDAVNLRKKLGLDSAYRVVFGEADYLPALIVDKFADCLVIQTLALGIDRMKKDIVEILSECYHPRCIYERNDVPIRRKEGLELTTGALFGQSPGVVEIEENGIRMLVDIENGQKTGYFLDQRENRAAIEPYVRGCEVLDCFCHTGGFALHAAKFGASAVEAVDISEPALEFVKQNAALNGFETITAKQANVFDLLKGYQDQKRLFDTVVLDPPAFCKTKSALPGAYRGYKEINLRAMKLIRPGGFLITCSCSHFMTPDLFLKMLSEASADVRVASRIIEIRYQAKDHPVAVNADESLYLKCVILQILG
ncbi:MAG TPA: class I SAM-dependent rRNA methyltransferase [Clostridia bacterium]|nr:class I SAM-dependent rRNA methyltransferase [Clostridia bacterium]